MVADSSSYTCPAALLARSLLIAWTSGDRRRMRERLGSVFQLASPPEASDDFERVELLKSIAGSMNESSDLFLPRSENQRVAIWLDLLNHLAAQPLSRICADAGYVGDPDAIPAVVRH